MNDGSTNDFPVTHGPRCGCKGCLRNEIDLVRRASSEALIETWKFLRESAEGIASYGFFCGGDPREFTPDGENTPEEHEAHRLACEAWDRGEKMPDPKPSGRIEIVTLPETPDGKGGIIPERTGPAICCGGSYGPGVNIYRDPDVERVFALVEAAMAALGIEKPPNESALSFDAAVEAAAHARLG